MDQRLMRTMLDVDERHWWYRGRREIIDGELARLPIRHGGSGSGRRLRIGPGRSRSWRATARGWPDWS